MEQVTERTIQLPEVNRNCRADLTYIDDDPRKISICRKSDNKEIVSLKINTCVLMNYCNAEPIADLPEREQESAVEVLTNIWKLAIGIQIILEVPEKLVETFKSLNLTLSLILWQKAAFIK